MAAKIEIGNLKADPKGDKRRKKAMKKLDKIADRMAGHIAEMSKLSEKFTQHLDRLEGHRDVIKTRKHRGQGVEAA